MTRGAALAVGLIVAAMAVAPLSAQRRGGGSPPLAPGEIANFTLVQTLGCLVEQAPRQWRLVQATEMVATKDVPVPDAELRALSVVPAGSLTFQLVSVLPFKPETQAGRRVVVKGILNRYPGEDPLLNVTQLQPLPASNNCQLSSIK